MYMFKTKGDWGDTYGSLDPNILINELSTSLKEQRDSDCIEKILDRIVKWSHNVMRKLSAFLDYWEGYCFRALFSRIKTLILLRSLSIYILVSIKLLYDRVI